MKILAKSNLTNTDISEPYAKEEAAPRLVGTEPNSHERKHEVRGIYKTLVFTSTKNSNIST